MYPNDLLISLQNIFLGLVPLKVSLGIKVRRHNEHCA